MNGAAPLVRRNFHSRIWIRQAIVALGVLVAVVVVAFLGWRPRDQAATAERALPLVRTAPALRTDVEVTKSVIGTVLAYGQVNVQTQISGMLIAAPFTEGQFVRRGEILFEIDPRPARAALEQTESTLAKDEAALANAEKDVLRYTALFSQNLVPTRLRDQAITAVKSDKAIVGADRASIEIAKLNLEYTTIRSPVDGKTGAIQAQPGNIVYANGGQRTNTLVTITELRPVKISFSLPQSEIGLVLAQAKGRSLRIVYSEPDANRSERVAAADFVDSAVDSQSGTVDFRALVANEGLTLWPGEMLNVRVILKRLRNVIVIPREAVNYGPDGDYVYALDRDDEVARVPVVLLDDNGTRDAVSGRLSLNQKVVTEGQFRIAPGMRVSVVDRPAPPVSVSDTRDLQ